MEVNLNALENAKPVLTKENIIIKGTTCFT